MIDQEEAMAEKVDVATHSEGSHMELAGKYLTFKLGHEEYGVEILRVREIIGLMEITAVPRTPQFIRGVINLRGKVIPVMDLRLKFGMDAAEDTDETCVIVVDTGGVEMGVLVDEVSEVLDIAADDIEDAPSFGVSVNTDFILGMGKINDRVTILLNIGKVVARDDEATLAVAAERGEKEAVVA